MTSESRGDPLRFGDSVLAFAGAQQGDVAQGGASRDKDRSKVKGASEEGALAVPPLAASKDLGILPLLFVALAAAGGAAWFLIRRRRLDDW